MEQLARPRDDALERALDLRHLRADLPPDFMQRSRLGDLALEARLMRVERGRHLVDGDAEIRELVAAAERDALGVFALPDPAQAFDERVHGPCHIAPDEPADDESDDETGATQERERRAQLVKSPERSRHGALEHGDDGTAAVGGPHQRQVFIVGHRQRERRR